MVKKLAQKRVWEKLKQQKINKKCKNEIQSKYQLKHQYLQKPYEFLNNGSEQQRQLQKQIPSLNVFPQPLVYTDKIINRQIDFHTDINILMNFSQKIKDVFCTNMEYQQINQKYFESSKWTNKQFPDITPFQRLKEKKVIKQFIQRQQDLEPQICQISSYKRQMLNVSRISFLSIFLVIIDIYGTVGVGKTHLVRKIVQELLLTDSCIWLNGLCLLQHKSNRLSQQTNQIIQSWLASASQLIQLAKQKSSIKKLILIIDQYDQIHHLNFLEVIRYAHSTHLNSHNQKFKQLPKSLSLFKKVILISNYHIKQQFNTGKSSISKLIKRHKISVQQLFFTPFKDTQIYEIIQGKIQIINKLFSLSFKSSTKNQQNSKVFDCSYAKIVIKKLAVHDNNDIRKAFSFFKDVYQQFIKGSNLQQVLTNNKPVLITNQFINKFLSNQQQNVLIAYFGKLNQLQNIVLLKILSLIKQKTTISSTHKFSLNESLNTIRRRPIQNNNNQHFNVIYLQQLYQLVQGHLKLNRLCLMLKEWQEAGLLSLDTQSNKNQVKQQKICLIQNWKIKFKGDIKLIYNLLTKK